MPDGPAGAGAAARPAPPPRKRFVCHGPLLPSDVAHFMREFREEELAPILEAIDDHRVVNVVGPRQAGKTTLLHVVRARYPNHVFVSGERSLATLRELPPTALSADAWTIFNTALWRAAQGQFSESPLATLVPESEWRYPLSSCDWVAGAFLEPPLLVIDEFDLVGTASPAVLDTLLHGLRAMLPGLGGSPAVTAIIVAGPPSILHMRTTSGSDWHVLTTYTPRRFDVGDLRVLFDEWAAGEGVPPVEDAVLEGIIELTRGHRGWTMMAAGELVGVKPTPAFTAEWWTEGSPGARIVDRFQSTHVVERFMQELSRLGVVSALLAGTVLSIVGQREAAGDPVWRGDAVVRDWAPVLGLLTDVGAVVYDGDVRRLLVGPAVFATAVDDVLRRLSCCEVTCIEGVNDVPTSVLLAHVAKVQQRVVALAGSLSSKSSAIVDGRVPAESCSGPQWPLSSARGWAT